MTDFHSHILPGIDDGSKSLEMSLQMLRMEAAQGINMVVATPHFYSTHESPEHFLQKRDHAEKILRQAMAEEPELPQLRVGAEVYYFRGISQSEFLPLLTIQGTNCVLIEMPLVPWEKSMYRELEAIREKRDLIPIVAHMDRYLGIFRRFGIPKRLENLPVLVQANTSFFLNPVTARSAMKMLKKDQIQLIGSDCHNLTSRIPNMGDALRLVYQKMGREALGKLSNYEDILFDF